MREDSDVKGEKDIKVKQFAIAAKKNRALCGFTELRKNFQRSLLKISSLLL